MALIYINIVSGYSRERTKQAGQDESQEILHIQATIEIVTKDLHFLVDVSEKMSRVYDDLILHITPDKFFIESLSEQQVRENF